MPIPSDPFAAAHLQSAIDAAMSRGFLYRFLAKAFEDPNPPAWEWLCDPQTHHAVHTALAVLNVGQCVPPAPGQGETHSHFTPAEKLLRTLTPEAFDNFLLAHVTAFGHAARGDCPLNEIEYGDIKADPLFQPHRLADLGAFYHAFGLELGEDAAERQDHIAIELEFMSVLAAKEAYALENQLDEEQLALCRDTQKQFLREHLGRWTPAFARRLARTADGTALGTLAILTREFIEAECHRFGVKPGNEQLLLRPVDAAEALCTSCGIANLPPGAA